MNITTTDDIEITSDGKTVWVNDAHGCCIGRFSRNGVDIHRTLAEQIEGASECLDCTHGIDSGTWERFVAGMLEYHSVVVPDIHKPKFLTAGSIAAAEVEG